MIALTGGIAAGKSTVAQRLREHGAIVIDADTLAREAVEPGTAGLTAVVETFGPGLLNDAGGLDRAALGRLVFADADSLQALNAIVHPEVRRLYHERVDAALDNDPTAIVVYDVPLLAEARAQDEFALVVVVDAPADVRIDRLMTHRGMPEHEARGRVAAQMSDEQRRAMADIVVDSSGTRESTLEATDALWTTLSSRGSVGGAE